MVEAVLRDGALVDIRPLADADVPAVRDFIAQLAPASLRQRFGEAATVESVTDMLTAPAGATHQWLAATIGGGGPIVAQGGFDATGPERARVRVLVADDFAGRGLATLLLGRLAELAEHAGIVTFEAVVPPQPGPMLDVVGESGLATSVLGDASGRRVEISTLLTPAARERYERRHAQAAAAAVRALLEPRSIAVVGASRDETAVGGRLLRNLREAGYTGELYAVNPAGGDVQGLPAYATVGEVPAPLELAIIAVPAELVAASARQCAASRAKGLIVVSAGFAEVGAAGIERQAELLRVCREAGMRLIGPNCMGVINTAAGVRLNGQFAPVTPLAGSVGVLSQSGALGLALIHQANALGLGLSTFVSVGNQADLSGDDLLCYWEEDPATEVILLYLESIASPRRFARSARRVSRSKPIIAVKSGRSGAGARATTSHTGGLIGASDVTVDALFRQAGVIRTDTLAEMFDVATLVAGQPLPEGRGVAILTNGGGPGILAADACAAAGLELPALNDAVQRSLAEHLPAVAGVTNPVDMIASATPADYARAIELIASDPAIAALIVISGPPLATPTDELATAIRRAVASLPRPLTVATVFMSTAAPGAALRGDGVVLPAYAQPENAAYALGHAARYGEWRRGPLGEVVTHPDVRPAEAAALAAAAVALGRPRWLEPAEVAALLDCYGLPTAEQRLVTTPAEAAAAAGELAGPVALKGIARAVVHKTEARGVQLNLATPAAVESAARQMADAYAAAGLALDGFLVQRMAPVGVELLIGVVHDGLFGPVVACAAGGVQAELLKDVAVRITPLTDVDAAQMVRSLATFPLLDGYRGAARLDVAAVEDILLRVSAMVEAHPEIAEMDLNPVIVLRKGALIVDARIRIETPPVEGR